MGDIHDWLLAVVGASNLSISKLLALRPDVEFAKATGAYFAQMFGKQPEKFSRFSTQMPLPWDVLLRLTNGTKRLALELAKHARMAFPMADITIFDGEPVQIIHYGIGGHYAPHSDSGWPGHRPASAL